MKAMEHLNPSVRIKVIELVEQFTKYHRDKPDTTVLQRDIKKLLTRYKEK